MIPIIFESNEENFTSNGLGRLYDCARCEVTEERNGIYECEFDYPVDGVNYDKLKCGRIIGVEHDDTSDIQPFDIYSYSRPLNGLVTYHARHISYRLNFSTVKGTSINSLSAAFALFNTSEPDYGFSFWTDKTSTGYMAAADGLPKTVRQMLGGVEGSVLDVYGGEYEWDKWTVKLWSSRGEDKDFSIRYGVNLTDYSEDTDYGSTYTAVIPYWTGEDEKIVGDMISSGLPSYDGREACIPLDLTDKFENTPTKAQVEAEAKKYLASNSPNLPGRTISISFIRLGDSQEYHQFRKLQNCRLCDSVKVIFPRYGVEGSYKIVKTVYDVLQERYTEMELGNLSTSLAEALGIK